MFLLYYFFKLFLELTNISDYELQHNMVSSLYFTISGSFVVEYYLGLKIPFRFQGFIQAILMHIIWHKKLSLAIEF